MKNLLALPDEFRITKNLTKEKFLLSAALLENDKEKIERLVSDIDLLYDIKYPDGSEIIVVDVLLKMRLSFDTDAEIAGIIAKSIPHHCIFLSHADDFGKIIVFQTRQHSSNNRRKIIENQTSSPIFSLKRISPDIAKMIYWVKEHLQTSNSADNAIKYCKNDLKSRKRYKRF